MKEKFDKKKVKLNKLKENYFSMQKIVCQNLAVFFLFIGYWVTVFPTSLLMKCVGRDRLNIKRKNVSSYWTDNMFTDTDYERPF